MIEIFNKEDNNELRMVIALLEEQVSDLKDKNTDLRSSVVHQALEITRLRNLNHSSLLQDRQMEIMSRFNFKENEVSND
jgi:hypothetical protein